MESFDRTVGKVHDAVTLVACLAVLVPSHDALAEPGEGRADVVNTASLVEETMLHPLDSFTAYTLAQGEWAWNIPLALPVGWLWWGVTDWMTVEIDTEAWLGLVPSANARFSLGGQEGLRPALAYETMYQYLHREIDLVDDYDFLEVNRRGSSWYHRINASWRMSPTVRLHASVGATYSQSLELTNGQRESAKMASFEHLISPDASVAIDYRPFAWLTTHAALSYGTTFTYLDNVPRKSQLSAGVRIAPFATTGWWMVRNLRAELSFLVIYFDDVDEVLAGPVPYVYWQWGG